MIFPHVPITINIAEVLRYLGYKKRTSESTDEIDALIESMIKKATYIIEPKGIIKNVKITSRNLADWEIVCDNGLYVIKGEKVYSHLENCQYVTLLAVTIGEQLDAEIDQRFQEKEPTKALILDAIGSDAVERVADYVNEYVNKEANRKGYGTRFRFSPGYGGWSVENQQDLIGCVDAVQIGIRTTEYSQLIPRKSVSAVVGWFANNQEPLPKLKNQRETNQVITQVNTDSVSSIISTNEHEITEANTSNQCSRCGLEDCQFQE